MKHSRVSRVASALMVAMVVSVWLAPAAHAQLIGGGGGDSGGGVIGDIGGAIGGGGGGSSDDGGSSDGGLVGGIADGLEGGSSDSGSDGETSGGSTGVIGVVVDKIDESVDSGKDQVDKTTGGATDTVNDTGSSVGGPVGGTIGGIAETVDKVQRDLTGTGAKKNRKADRQGKNVSTSTPGVTGANVLGRSMADAMRVDGKEIALAKAEGKDFSGSATTVSARQSVISQIGKVAAAAAEQVAFPLVLTLLVIAFLMVQNRIDNKDPKLALAPVDSEHDLLSFT